MWCKAHKIIVLLGKTREPQYNRLEGGRVQVRPVSNGAGERGTRNDEQQHYPPRIALSTYLAVIKDTISAMLEGMIAVMVLRVSWRGFPASFGLRQEVYDRYAKRVKQGIWAQMWRFSAYPVPVCRKCHFRTST